MSSEGENWGSLPWSCRGKLDFYGGGSFAAPAANDFLDGQKATKEPPGGGRNRQKRLRRSCLHAARPLEPPLRGTRTWEVEQNFRRAKSERPSAVPSGPLSPGLAKIVAAAAPQPRLTLPNQRPRRGFRRRGGVLTRPPVGIWIAVQESILIRHGFAVPPYPFCPFGTFPPDRGNRPSPLGEGLRSGALAQHTQAQSENRTSSKFGPPRPQWGRKKTQASTPNFARRNHSSTSQESAPVKRGPGKGEYERGALILSRPRGRFAFFFATEKEGRRPQAAKSSAQKALLYRR